tara:strand:- start:65 stop:439 length:375 start_codon:yes stop_codon:yes gene_type:complete
MNNCNFEGRLAKDAELKEVSGYKVCNFAIGTNVGYGDNKKTMWVDCAIWGKQGEGAVRYLVKGQQIFVNGELSTREYEKNGVVKTILILKVNTFSFGAKPTNSHTNNVPNIDAPNDELVDEIPF